MGTNLQMALDLVVGEPIHLHHVPDLLRSGNCIIKQNNSAHKSRTTYYANSSEQSSRKQCDYCSVLCSPLTMGAAEALERGDESAVQLRRPAPPGLPRLLPLLLSGVRDSAAVGARGGRARHIDRR
jgi:hypothetical protein